MIRWYPAVSCQAVLTRLPLARHRVGVACQHQKMIGVVVQQVFLQVVSAPETAEAV